MQKKKVGIVIGSLRKESFSRKLANTLIALKVDSMIFEMIEIGQLTFYNQDLDDTPPSEWTDFRTKIKNLDGVIFITPEYNRSIPALIKNAIDIGSRPYGQNCWDGKSGAVISVSPGPIGGFGANQQLRQTLSFLNIRLMCQPEAYIGNVTDLLDNSEYGVIESTRLFLKKFLNTFEVWIKKNSDM